MSVNAKHLATFILGAAAGVAAHKYLQSEEGEKLLEDLKTKANNLKSEAEGTIDKVPEYFEELKAKGADTLKSNFPDAEAFFKDLYEKFVGGKGTAAEGTEVTPNPDPIS
ncbi:YtxH domain-containing protein [Dyadobacter pollutisoli]|uniref:YtxH domain-containing protein n=1 Tax=Dyadobacter pollutisoli TaxID=2910158 RepID=A0A9E8SNU4_9BACT|nr:YtxH domain-containing protein [Dyadobacter pollutisoli]WAC11147.1 YtxH domain-containing protein [Dyadobacter pollutisoli]